MKRIKIILGLILFTSVTTFAQSPRIKLNQITKDTVNGSVLISSPSDSGMVYSRDFYIAYGADTVLILYGDTLAATSGIISSVLSDGVTITGNGTSGNELKVDTLLIATIKALNDSLATISASTTPDGVTITGDGSVGNPLKVDTLLISTVKGLVDTLAARGYLTAEVDGSVSNEGSLTVEAGTATTSVISSNTSGSTDVTLTAGSNITLSETGNNITIAALGGGTTYNNISETADTVFITGDLNVDANTLRVDATTNKVGIGTSSPSEKLEVNGNLYIGGADNNIIVSTTNYNNFLSFETTKSNTNGGMAFFSKDGDGTDYVTMSVYGHGTSATTSNSDRVILGYDIAGFYKLQTFKQGNGTLQDLRIFTGSDNDQLVLKTNGNVGIGTSSPSYPLEMGSGAHVTTGGVWTDASDIKLKENINYYYPYGLNEIINLKPTVFDYINGEKNSLGFIAQDVFEVIPEAISSTLDENGNETMGIKMVSITATLVKAMQEQQSEIDQLKTLITDLTNRIQILENK